MKERSEDRASVGARGRLRVIAREWLLFLSLASLAGTSLYRGKPPPISGAELQVLFILANLLVSVRAMEVSGLFSRISGRLGEDRWVAPKLVAMTFFLAMAATNDAALVLMVPLTVALGRDGLDTLVILEALAANAGSALTPFGNPQNLFIYWYFGIEPGRFLAVMAPFSAVFLVLLLGAALAVNPRPRRTVPPAPTPVDRSVYPALGLLAVAILIILRILPLAAGLAVIGYALLFDRPSLRIDYGLLVTFLCFFGIAENMRLLVPPLHPGEQDTFLVSVAASQVMSNVPAALVMAKFTGHWKALLWGTNAGGFGSLFGSLANLIAYRLYLARAQATAPGAFTAKFLGWNCAALLISVGLYYLFAAGA